MFQRLQLGMTKKIRKAISTKMLHSEVMAVFRLTMVSCGASVADFISMTEPSKLVQKAICRPNATWNSVKNKLFPSLCDRSDSY